jgi:glycosyltransferase involved in cell wall biosynthesis
MRLLIVTQAVDTYDPVLGFFHRWIEELATHYEHVEVICLREGKHALPNSVRVHSLGKESGRKSRLRYALRFLALVARLRSEYDMVLVHMNQEYVLLGGFVWKLFGKRIYMWRNHYAGSWLTALAVALCTKVFCTSAYSYTAKFKKAVLMPVGVDTDTFKPVPETKRVPHSILSLGRIAPSKNIHVLISALRTLNEQQIDFTCDIYGDALPKDTPYLEGLKKSVAEARLSERVHFLGPVKHTDTPAVYSAHQIFVNTSRSGMYDKTILEAAACGCVVLASSRDFAKLADIEFSFREGDVAELAEKLEGHLAAGLAGGEKLHDIVAGNSIQKLGKALAAQMR